MEDPASQPVISVVVPCRGQARELRSCLRGLRDQVIESPYEIIVVDAAADPSVAAVAEGFPKARLVRDAAGLLAGEARNLGAEQARGRYLAFIDADCMPEAGWLAAALGALQTGADMVGGPILDLLPFHPLAAADNLMQFVEFSPARPEGAVSHFPGCNFAVTRETFLEVGGFPAGLPIGEDVSLTSAIAERRPGRVRFLHKVQVRHLGRRGVRAYWRHQETFGYYRGKLGQRLQPFQQRLGAWPLMAVAVAAKRFTYIVSRAVQWDTRALPRLILTLPGLLLGVTAYASGFRRGCREAMDQLK
jgi:glycosyltransferase involved in cell wall biosynthesis